MARGTIRRKPDRPKPWEAVIDLGPDPATGKRRQRTRSYRTRREAQVGLAAWLVEVDRGTAVDRSAATVADVLHDWLEAEGRHLSPRTRQMYEQLVRTILEPGLGHIAAQKLTPAEVERFYARWLAASAQRRGEGSGQRQMEACHQVLAQALKRAVRLGTLTRNVCDGVSRPKRGKREMQVWTAQQAQTFLLGAQDGRYGPMYAVALATGLRQGELLGIRWSDVDLERGTIQIRQTVGERAGKGRATRVAINPRPKTEGSRRTVGLDPALVAALRRWRSRQNEQRLGLGEFWHDFDLVFPEPDGSPGLATNVRWHFQASLKKTGVPRIRFHDLRHTYATLALERGMDIKAISQSLGHKNITITLQVYAHVTRKMEQQLVQTMGVALNLDDVLRAE